MARKNHFIHPHGDPKLANSTKEYVQENRPDIADAFLEPVFHPELEGYLLDNTGADCTPTRIRVLKGTVIHGPDGMPNEEGAVMIVPKHLADEWVTQQRVKKERAR